MVEQDIIYAAGFVDGEGCISISKSMGQADLYSVNPYHALRVHVNNTNREVIKWLQLKFGGKLYENRALGNSKDSFNWSVYSNDALIFLKLIQPYCIVKREQVKTAIEFQEGKKVLGIWKQIPKEEVERREQSYLQMKVLNRKGR